MCGILKTAGLGDGSAHRQASAIEATDGSTIPKAFGFEVATRMPGCFHTRYRGGALHFAQSKKTP
jgi:hypothetical protein